MRHKESSAAQFPGRAGIRPTDAPLVVSTVFIPRMLSATTTESRFTLCGDQHHLLI